MLCRRYKADSNHLTDRLINVNKTIYGKIYFPVYSNRLKDIASFIGASWTSSEASGLQSLAWRHYWDESRNHKYKSTLLVYNEEDCRALKLLTEELTKISCFTDSLPEVSFADQHKQRLTEPGKIVNSQFEKILKFAHFDYDKKKISFRDNHEKENKKDKSKIQRQNANKHHQKLFKIKKRAKNKVEIPSDESCPKCNYKPLRKTFSTSTRFIIDLVLTKSGVRKTITQYVGAQGYCQRCKKRYAPAYIRKYNKNQVYGHGLMAWVIYQRVALRLPYESIVDSLKEQFSEDILGTQPISFVRRFADYYAETEKKIFENLLKSPFIHADETRANIRGEDWYVWVFTDGKNVTFKLRKTREALILAELLSGYQGVLISDFYAGYDSVNSRQQKCWVHLIRNINDDLKANPLDQEFEGFVLALRELFIPIMETVQKYGLKKRNFNKFKPKVEAFYRKIILEKRYKSDLSLKYQKRFTRYKDSLFTFLEEDGIPWHNNTAERAIRPFAIQRDISKSPFHESITHKYLTYPC